MTEKSYWKESSNWKSFNLDRMMLRYKKWLYDWEGIIEDELENK